MGARSDVAHYEGASYLVLTAADESFYSTGVGDVRVDVNFETGTLAGDITYSDCDCGDGGIVVSPSTVEIAGTTLDGNSFSTTAQLTSGTLGLTSVSDLSVNGQFYENNATAVGGLITGTGALDGTDALLNGTFLAGEEPQFSDNVASVPLDTCQSKNQQNTWYNRQYQRKHRFLVLRSQYHGRDQKKCHADTCYADETLCHGIPCRVRGV